MNNKMVKTVMLSVVSIIVLSYIVFAALGSVNYIRPSIYTTLTSTGVNVSWNFNQTSNSELTWNGTIYNRSSSDGAYSVLDWETFNNASFTNITVTLKDNTRHWLYINVTNVTGGPIISETRIVDVDTGFLIFQLGVYQTLNFTLDTGDFTTSGIVDAKSFRANPTDILTESCSSTNRGMIRYNTTASTFYGCTSDGWKRFINIT